MTFENRALTGADWAPDGKSLAYLTRDPMPADEQRRRDDKSFVIRVDAPDRPAKRQSRAEVEKYVSQKFETDADRIRFERSELVLKKFGLLPRTFDLHAYLIKLLTEQVAGYYDEKTQTLNLTPTTPGRATVSLPAVTPGVWQASDGTRAAYAAAGAADPMEFADLRATGTLLRKLVRASGGGVHFIGTGKSPNDEKGHNVAPIALHVVSMPASRRSRHMPRIS